MARFSSFRFGAIVVCLAVLLSGMLPPGLPASAAPHLASTAQTNEAIARGLQHLHTSVQRSGADAGFWNAPYPEATAGTAVLAFEIQGHRASGGRIGDPYSDTVRRGLNYLLTSLRKQAIAAQPAGDPDTNGNGYGLYVGVSNNEVVIYSTGSGLMALAASGTPDAKAAAGGEGVQGRTYRDIAQDVVDYLAWAQTDTPNAVRGGWRYLPNSNQSDMSVTQWPVLGIEAAAANFKATVPAWVRTELRDYFLVNVQDSNGGFGYTGPDAGNVARTGAGLVSLAFCGVPGDDPRVQKAVDFIAQNWAADNLGNFYAMYGVMKGSKLTRPEIKTFGGHDWYAEYADYLVAHQSAEGSWQDSVYSRGNLALSTAWAVLILSPTVYTPLLLPRLPLWPFIVIPLALLTGLGLWLWRRGRPAQRTPVAPSAPQRSAAPPTWSHEEKKQPPDGARITHGQGKSR